MVSSLEAWSAKSTHELNHDFTQSTVLMGLKRTPAAFIIKTATLASFCVMRN